MLFLRNIRILFRYKFTYKVLEEQNFILLFSHFNPNRALKPSTDFVRLLRRCTAVSSKEQWIMSRCNCQEDVGKRTKAVGKHAGNSKSKQMRSNE